MNQNDREQQLIVRHMVGLDLDQMDMFALWFLDTYDVLRDQKITEEESKV